MMHGSEMFMPAAVGFGVGYFFMGGVQGGMMGAVGGVVVSMMM